MNRIAQILTATLALSVAAVPMASAQSRNDHPRRGYGYERSAPQPKAYHHRSGPNRQHWSKGHRVPDWQRRPVVRDYHRHGLKRPGRGQHWVRVGNDYLLVGIATGIIAGIIAGR